MNRLLLSNCLQQPLGQPLHGEMVPETSSQFPVLSDSGLLRTENWHQPPATAMLSRKCGELLAGLLGFCCWSCSLRPSGRWRWPVLPGRQPCTACDSRCPRIRCNRRCHAIMRWHSRGRPSPNRLKSDRLKSNRRTPRFNPPMMATAVRTIAAAALPPLSGRNPLPVCSPF